jgi:hypothetical protein
LEYPSSTHRDRAPTAGVSGPNLIKSFTTGCLPDAAQAHVAEVLTGPGTSRSCSGLQWAGSWSVWPG